MSLNNIKIGDYISLVKVKCNIPNLTVDQVSGINKNKEFFEPSKQVGNDTSNYKIVPPGCYACNLMHIGRDCVLPIAVNRTDKNKYVSPAYTVFKLNDNDVILSEYLFMILNSKEKDRYFWFHCDSSVRDGMEWNLFCDIELEIPSIEIQKKYVAIYEGLLANLHSYEKGLDDLKLVCDGYIESLMNKYPMIELSKFIKQRNEPNSNLKYKVDDVVGVSAEKKIIPTKADVSKNDISKFILVRPYDFIYNPRNGIAVGLNETNKTKIISWNNTCFYISDEYKENIDCRFLFMYLCRKEWDRKTKFLSWGSSTEVFTFNSLCETQIPLAPFDVQNSIIKIYNQRQKSLKYIETLKQQISDICPILIRGSINESIKQGN